MAEPDIAATARTLEGHGANDVAATVRPFEMDETVAATASGPRTLAAAALPKLHLGDAKDATGDLEQRGLLGEGGMGIVELVRQRSLARDVAVKRLRGDLSDANAVRGLLAEASFTGYLEHPSIVPVHALGHDSELGPLMVMKKVEGVTLAALLSDPVHRAWEAARGDRLAWLVRRLVEVAHALELAHDRGVLHRDIKPENIMVGGFGEVYLLDWGIAIRSSDASSLTADAIAGTPCFMAPEMIRPSDGGTSVRTDVYLLGATLHSALTGGDARHPGSTMAEVLIAAIESVPARYDDEVPAELGKIANRATARDPADRYASVAVLREALEAWLEHRASAELAQVAEAKLDELRAALATDTPEAALVHSLFHASRFGLEQALRGWAENEAAEASLRDALITMTRFEVAQRNLPSARAVAAGLDPLPDDLHGAIQNLEAEIAAEAAVKKRLEQIAHELDPVVSKRQRTIAIRIMGGLGLMASAGLYLFAATGTQIPDPGAIGVVFAAPVLFVGVGSLYYYRSIFLGTQINRLMALTILVTMICIFLHDGIGLIRGDPHTSVAVTDGLIVAVASALSALSIRRTFVLPAVAFIVAAYVGAVEPDWAMLSINTAVTVSIIFILSVGERWPDPLIGRLKTADEEPGEA